ncbi:MAG: pseudouridine-5'-phosphate glycosidase [Gemmatimonadota bacterium]|nr:pseudouridine-5'-phosphate glycosidase [Gemmatimonadota bacterium]
MRLAPDVAEALAAGRPVVALESSVLAQGLPLPANREAAVRMTAAVRSAGATPAITAVVEGVPAAGIDRDELERILLGDRVAKVAARDLPVAMAQRGDGATTVSAALLIACQAGIRVLATGGIGGVHREADYDESADLGELARTPAVVVCAGPKSILDLQATVERLETLGVTVVGYGTSELPGFFSVGTGIALSARADSAGEVADIWAASRALGRPGAVLVVQPPPAAVALPRAMVEAAIETALARARAEGVRGAEVTPFLLAAVDRETGGRSLGANLALLEHNAALGGEIAAAIARRSD